MIEQQHERVGLLANLFSIWLSRNFALPNRLRKCPDNLRIYRGPLGGSNYETIDL